MKLLFKNNYILFILFSCFLVAGGLAIALTEKRDLHVYFNGYVGSGLNPLFTKLTYLGDGIFVVGAIAVLAFANCRMFMALISAYVASSIVVQVLKNFIFNNVVRPSHFFGALNPPVKLNLVEGIDMLGLYSFPSGHTTAAFSFFFTLALLQQNRWSKIFLFILALFVGLSRVYLSQHFFEDVYAGAIIGTFFAVIACYLFYFSPSSGKFNKLDTSVVRLFSSAKK